MTFPSYSGSLRLLWALAISLFAHAVVLLQGNPPVPKLHMAQMLTATLTATSLPANAEHVAVSPRQASATRTAVAARKFAAPLVPDSAVSRHETPPPIHDGTQPPETDSSSSAAARPATGAPSAATSEEGLDANGMRSYLVALATELRRFKRYPPRALEAGWAGTVEVRIVVSANGTVQSSRLEKSSGYPVLDEKAVDMVRNAAPRAALPESLRGRAFPLTLTIGFDLAE